MVQVLSLDGTTEVGKISKQWAGLAKEMFTNATNFGITFPMDLDVKMKACMMGAMFLIVSLLYLFYCYLFIIYDILLYMTYYYI